ncbi:MAG: phosphoglucosamine mutase [Elusimicrobiota bacterium]|jgi:phosphoglucosamine mutase|nr:phosphoglucosamine mutase [Elusimicrobiota bacterium]
MPKYFGTDGIRAIAGEFPLTRDFVIKTGFCALKEIAAQDGTDRLSKTVLIAEDSRASGPQIAKFLSDGILAAGFNVTHIGIAPTPAVSYLVSSKKFICGVVISASHNPAEFNGIKFFNHDGRKLNEDLENKIETAIENTRQIPLTPPEVKFIKNDSLIEEYIDFLKSTLPPQTNFKGLKIVLDCANGASYKTAPQVFKDLGVETIMLFDKPNGLNINDNAGALHTQTMQKTVKEKEAFMGFSFDGDADRVIACDEEGNQFDGDDILATAALHLKSKNLLKNNKVVLTVMANLGLINFLKQNGIEPVLTAVGDKYVFEALEKEGLSLGGETSGHIILRNIAPTGDGVLCALQLLSIIKLSGKKPSWFKKQWKKYPLELISVWVDKKIPLEEVKGFLDYVKTLESQMGGAGKIFVRYSGTEPLLRILVEGEDEKQVAEIARKTEDFYKSTVKKLRKK